jgi:peptidoglycan hydrolase CwlO-like protein
MRKLVFLQVFAVIVIVIGLTSVRRQSLAQEKAKVKTLRERVETLEKEMKALKVHIASKLQRGNYRMSELDADIRELHTRNDEQDRRLIRGKHWMAELQRKDTAIMDMIIRFHPKAGPRGGKK